MLRIRCLPPPNKLTLTDRLAWFTIVSPDGGAPLADLAVAGSEPFDIDFATVGEFYHKIESGFNAIPEAELFIGPPEAQADPSALDFGG